MELILALERMLWTVPLPLVLMGSHLYFTLHLRGIQGHTLRGIRAESGERAEGERRSVGLGAHWQRPLRRPLGRGTSSA